MEFTHFDKEGNAAMVDVGGKEITRREAVAEGYIGVSETCFQVHFSVRMYRHYLEQQIWQQELVK